MAKAINRTSAAPPPHRCDCTAVLNAAEEVVLRDGIGRLTLDAVAREARLSKSGLLHYFPSKEALIDALVGRKIDEWRDDTTESYTATPEGPGRAVRAILSTCLSSTDQWTDAMRRSSVVLVAALVHDSKHVEPLRRVNQELHERFAKDGIPVGVCDLVHLAVHGMWFDWIFGLSDWTPQRLTAVRGAIQQLLKAHRVKAGVAKAAGATSASPKRKQAATSSASSTRNGRATAAPRSTPTHRAGTKSTSSATTSRSRKQRS